jgi:hypothetical protein
VETLTNYGSHTTDGRTVTVVSATGQHLKITTYGGYIGWATWATATVSAALPAGRMVKIRATATGSSGSNLDRLTIS